MPALFPILQDGDKGVPPRVPPPNVRGYCGCRAVCPTSVPPQSPPLKAAGVLRVRSEQSHPISYPVPTCFAALHPSPPQAAVQQLVGARGAGPGHQPGSGFVQEHLDWEGQ